MQNLALAKSVLWISLVWGQAVPFTSFVGFRRRALDRNSHWPHCPPLDRAHIWMLFTGKVNYNKSQNPVQLLEQCKPFLHKKYFNKLIRKQGWCHRLNACSDPHSNCASMGLGVLMMQSSFRKELGKLAGGIKPLT